MMVTFTTLGWMALKTPPPKLQIQRSRDPTNASTPPAQPPWGLTGRTWLQGRTQWVVLVVVPSLNSLGIDSRDDVWEHIPRLGYSFEKKYKVAQDDLLFGQIYPEHKKTVTALHHGNIFLTKWPGWWLGADEHLKEGREINDPVFILKILLLGHKHNTFQ